MIAGELREAILFDAGVGQVFAGNAVRENVIDALAGELGGKASDFAGCSAMQGLQRIDISRIEELLNRGARDFAAVSRDIFTRARFAFKGIDGLDGRIGVEISGEQMRPIFCSVGGEYS